MFVLVFMLAVFSMLLPMIVMVVPAGAVFAVFMVMFVLVVMLSVFFMLLIMVVMVVSAAAGTIVFMVMMLMVVFMFVGVFMLFVSMSGICIFFHSVTSRYQFNI